MPLSEIAIGIIMLLCMAGFLRITTQIQKHCDEEVAKLQKHINDLERDYFALSGEVADVDSKVDMYRKKVDDKVDILEEQEKEIRRWNEGITNIMNYSLDVAKGGNKP